VWFESLQNVRGRPVPDDGGEIEVDLFQECRESFTGVVRRAELAHKGKQLWHAQTTCVRTRVCVCDDEFDPFDSYASNYDLSETRRRTLRVRLLHIQKEW